MTNRTVKTYILMDNDKNLPVEHSLVHTFDNVITEDDDQVTIQQILVDNDIKGILEKHNKKREGVVNQTILERTGSEVVLRPITIKDLDWMTK